MEKHIIYKGKITNMEKHEKHKNGSKQNNKYGKTKKCIFIFLC